MTPTMLVPGGEDHITVLAYVARTYAELTPYYAEYYDGRRWICSPSFTTYGEARAWLDATTAY